MTYYYFIKLTVGGGMLAIESVMISECLRQHPPADFSLFISRVGDWRRPINLL